MKTLKGREAGAGGSHLVPPALSGLPCSRQALRLAMLRDMQASFSSARVRIVQVGNIGTDVYLAWTGG